MMEEADERASILLTQEYGVDTPESVTFAYEVAGIGNRFIATLIDSVVLAAGLATVLLLFIVGLALTGDLDNAAETFSWAGGLLLATYVLVNFVLFWGYYIFFEALWNGQTPGKRRVGIRVVALDGNPVDFTAVLVRNLVRIVDFLPIGYGVGLVAMFANRQARRLGDLAAGTLVVKEQREIDLNSLSLLRTEEPTLPVVADSAFLDYPALRSLSHSDYDLIIDTLGRYESDSVTPATVQQLAEVIGHKVQAAAPGNAYDSAQFLRRVVAAYRQMH